jgi:hypothetical protein
VKKLAALILLGLLLFNWGGYHLLYDGMAKWADEKFQLALDETQYDEADGLHIKIPASLPYGSNSEQYERVAGSIEINGITYSYVKRRFYQDTLELVCLPNLQTTQIKNARDAFAGLANDFNILKGSSPKKAASPKPVKLNLSDLTHEHHFFSWQFSNGKRKDASGGLAFEVIPSGWQKRIEHPPPYIA